MDYRTNRTSRGNYSCPWCDKKHKTHKGSQEHIEYKHKPEAEADNISRELVRANDKLANENIRLKRQIESIEQDKEAQKDIKRYSVIVYCSNCKRVSSVTIQHGVKVENASCFRCGTLSCMPVYGKIL